ncbi:hypothetical protein R1sor_005449 [Riccia sorocarpa]|uniref:Protein kinase domain-containing protein n=1 Tax=Riccia sorocarpa TaxID=122646 RepID=A0ABD3HK74_9MARC
MRSVSDVALAMLLISISSVRNSQASLALTVVVAVDRIQLQVYNGMQMTVIYKDLTNCTTPRRSLCRCVASVSLETSRPTDNEQELKTAMVFYPGNADHDRIPRSKFCYHLDVYYNESEAPRNYLLRATFPSRNLTAAVLSLNLYSTRFYFSVDSTYIATIELDEKTPQIIDLIIIPLSRTVHVCLVPLEDRSSMPAISALELRPFAMEMYNRSFQSESWGTFGPKSSQGSYLVLFNRTNFGGDPLRPSVRYPSDAYDRIWFSPEVPSSKDSKISMVKDTRDLNFPLDADYDYPVDVYSTAWEAADLTDTISFNLNLTEPRVQTPTPTFYINLLFHETMPGNSTRFIDILHDPGNGRYEFYDGLEVPDDWMTVNHKRLTFMSDSVIFTIQANGSSDLPAIISGVEIYGEMNPIISKTMQDDVDVVQELFTNYSDQNTLFDRAGDPCLPIPWAWLVCSMELPPRVTQINVTGKGVNGSLPHTLGGLSRLTVLDLSNNSLTGPLPNSLGNISSLRALNLEGNKLFGDLPPFEPKALQTLEYLSLANNQLDGNLSSLVTALDDSVSALNMSTNFFNGPIPVELKSLTNLRSLEFSHNYLTGELPTDLWGLENLEVLNLDHNQLTGNIPDSMWTLPKLESVNLENNSFTVLNLTTWYSAVTKMGSFDAVVLKVRLLGNQIENVILPPHDVSLRLDNDLRNKSHPSPTSFILLGDSLYCKGLEKRDKTLIQRYICRSDPKQEFWDPPDKGQAVSTSALIAVGVICGLLVFIKSCVLIFFLRRYRRHTRELHDIQEALAKEGVKPPFFKYSDLKAATRSFSDSSILGVGGFGTVYKAELQDGNVLAVKKLVPTEQNMSDFLREMVNITGIKHRHLIQLKGCCVAEKQQRMLVYEYAENRNLAEALWGAERPFLLSWKQRFRICLGIARGLAYLHEELQPKMIHRDIKPQNILLDKDFNPKIADFGLILPTLTDNTHITSNIGGTKGYLSPEYLNEGMISEKVDVYSFGVVLLEIVSGRKCVDYNLPKDQIFLRNWAEELYERDQLLHLVDESLIDYNVEEVYLVVETALVCSQLEWRKRPTMSQVVTSFVQYEDPAIDIARGLKCPRKTLGDIPEEDMVEVPIADDESQVRPCEIVLSARSTDSSQQAAIELSTMRPR